MIGTSKEYKGDFLGFYILKSDPVILASACDPPALSGGEKWRSLLASCGNVHTQWAKTVWELSLGT